MKRIGIIGATISGNHGAEAMLSSTVTQLLARYPEAEIIVYSYFPAEDRLMLDERWQGRITVRSATPAAVLGQMCMTLFGLLLRCCGAGAVLRRPEFCAGLAGCDVLVNLQGISFSDERLLNLPYYALCVLPAWLLGVRVVLLSQSLGPFSNGINRAVSRYCLQRCAQVVARGDTSFFHLQSLGLRGVALFDLPDTAFALHDSLCREGRLPSLPHESLIGFCPSSVVWKKMQRIGVDPCNAYLQILQRLRQEGKTVVVFATAARTCRSWRNNDLPLMATLRKEFEARNMPGSEVIWVEEMLSATQLQYVIRQIDYLVASRFHAMILALSAGKPCCVLGWSHKYCESLQMFHREEDRINYRDMHYFLTRLEGFLQEKDKISGQIQQEMPDIKARSLTQFDLI